jgi:hypothetical protein
MKKDPNRYPKGLDREKVKAIIDYYEKQSDADAVAEGERAFYRKKIQLPRVPAASFRVPNHQWRILA